MLKLKLKYFSHLIQRADSLKEIPMLGKIEGKRCNDRGGGALMVSLPQWTWVSASSRRWWRTGKPGKLQSLGCKESDTTELLNNSPCWHWRISTQVLIWEGTTHSFSLTIDFPLVPHVDISFGFANHTSSLAASDVEYSSPAFGMQFLKGKCFFPASS